MNKRIKVFGCLCLMVCMLAGCGEVTLPESFADTSLIVNENGTITYWLVDDFDKDYYKISELKDMATKEAVEFSVSFKEEGVATAAEVDKVLTLAEDPSKIAVVYTFSGGKSFARFTDTTFFYGTVEDAYKNGYELKGKIAAVKGNSTMSDLELKQQTKDHLIITDLKIPIYLTEKAVYVSPGAVVTEDGYVDLSNVSGTAFILLK